MSSPTAPSPPPVMPIGAQASVTTPMRIAKKKALQTVDELQQTEEDTIPATQPSPYTPLKQKQLFEATR